MTTTGAVEPSASEAWLPLVGRIAAGDRQAEQALVAHFQRGIRALVRRHCRVNDPAIDDIVQDIICHVLERLRLGAIKDPQALPAYIRMAVVNATTAEYRRRKLRGDPVSYDEDMQDLAVSEDPGEAMDAERASLLIRQLVAELPVRRDREILLRFYLQDAGKDAVCRDLGIDAAHFHRVIHRARERLRGLLARIGIGAAPGTSKALARPTQRKRQPDAREGNGP